MMETLQGTMSSLFMGLGKSLNGQKTPGKKGGEEECAVMWKKWSIFYLFSPALIIKTTDILLLKGEQLVS